MRKKFIIPIAQSLFDKCDSSRRLNITILFEGEIPECLWTLVLPKQGLRLAACNEEFIADWE